MENKDGSLTRSSDVASKSLSDALRLSFNIIKVLVGIVIILFLTSGVFVVEQHEAGLVLRFGKTLDRVLEPGLHWAWPFLIDEHVKVPVGRIHTVEISFMPKATERERMQNRLKPGIDWYLLTGDVNIIHSKWIARYRINDPLRYITEAENPEAMLKTITEEAILKASGSFDVDSALRTDVDGLRRKVQSEISSELMEHNIGIMIEGIEIDSIIPPPQVRDAFVSVILAEQERSEKISSARAYAGRTLSSVEGDAGRIISEAETYKTSVSERARADEQYMVDLLKEYPGEPEKLAVFLDQLYLDALTRVIAGLDEKFIIERSAGRDREIRYTFGRERGN
jgi:modulator of FtsH protease HflK